MKAPKRFRSSVDQVDRVSTGFTSIAWKYHSLSDAFWEPLKTSVIELFTKMLTAESS